MNPDLAMGDELLKKTGAGNLFMVFGEPDLDRQDRRTARSTVELHGVDVYDPTTGEVRIQLDRRHRLLVHRHRLQRRELLRPPRLLHRRRTTPTSRLKRALRADIDEAAWSTLYSHRQPPVRPARDRQDRRQGHQPLRRRSHAGLRGGRVSGGNWIAIVAVVASMLTVAYSAYRTQRLAREERRQSRLAETYVALMDYANRAIQYGSMATIPQVSRQPPLSEEEQRDLDARVLAFASDEVRGLFDGFSTRGHGRGTRRSSGTRSGRPETGHDS